MKDNTEPLGQSVKSDTGPFAIIPAWLFEATADSKAIHLYGILARHADRETHSTWPKRKTLAEEMNVNPVTIDRAIKVLVGVGALLVTPRFSDEGDRTSNLYTVLRVRRGGDTSVATGADTDEEADLEVVLNQRETSGEVSLVGGTDSDVHRIYDHWREQRGRARRSYDKISPARRQKIQTRLKEFTVDELLTAIDGVGQDPWPDRPQHDDITTIFRSHEQVEKFLGLAEEGVRRKPDPSNVTARDLIDIRDRLNAKGER